MKKLFLVLIILSSVLSGQDSFRFPMGVIAEEDTMFRSLPQKAVMTRSFYESSPHSYSLKKYAPLPKSQGKYGTCTGWAVAYAARTIVEAKNNRWTSKDKITKNAFSPTFQYRQGSKRKNCSGAATVQVVKSLKTVGSVPMKNFRTTFGNTLCPASPLREENYEIADDFRIDEYTKLWPWKYSLKSGKISRVKASLSQGNPVVIAMICPDSFHRVRGNGLWKPTERPDVNVDGKPHGRHAMCVVGYDNQKYGGAFEVQNSWGRGWGNSGYVWIKYNDFADFVYEAVEIVKSGKDTEETILAGSLRLFDLDDNKNLSVKLTEKNRNWTVVGPSGNNTYEVVPRLLSGSEMRMYMRCDKPACVYMLGTGEKDKSISRLFPVDGISPVLDYSRSEVALPSEDHYFKMDNTTGTNYIILIFAKNRVDINSVKNTMAKSDGPLSARLYNSLGKRLIDPEYISLEKDEIKFSVSKNDNGKDVFALILQFKQVN